MDRNRDSNTYGCLCRPFWHDKITDFPSAHQQIGILPLAIVYGNKIRDNPYYKEERIQELCKAGINYWKDIQRRNGSFDEHYPREHSLGATAWSLWAVTEAVKHLDNPPDISETVNLAVEFISSQDEPGTIANHQAVTASALFNASKIVDVPSEPIKERIKKVENLQSDEGWFQEYKGGDPGYQSTSITHLARIWKDQPSWIEDEMLSKAIKFFESFIDNENYYGYNLGARRTQHVHPTGFEILSGSFESAERVAYCLRENTRKRNLIMPTAIDDKHFSWHQAEFLDSYLNSSSIEEKTKSISNKRYQDFLIQNKNSEKLFINLSKGGYLKHYKSGSLINENQGITTEIGDSTYTSNWMNTTEEIDIDGDTVRISGYLRNIPENNLNWWKHMALRGFQHTVGRIPKLSFFMKNTLIEELITGSNSEHEFKRTIHLDNGKTEDKFEGRTIEGKTRSMFIPNSEYFHK